MEFRRGRELHLPEIDRADDSRMHVRRRESASHVLGDWKGARRQFSDSALMRGSESGGRWTSEDQACSDPDKQKLRDAQDRPISEDVATAIRDLAARFGLDAEQLLKSPALRMSADFMLGRHDQRP